MPLFSEEDHCWLEDIAWDLQEIADDACAFVQMLTAIGQSVRCGWNVSIDKHDEMTGRPTGFRGLPDLDQVHWLAT